VEDMRVKFFGRGFVKQVFYIQGFFLHLYYYNFRMKNVVIYFENKVRQYE